MGIKFLGTPIKQFDKLCSEEEKVVIKIECYKSEGVVDKDGRYTVEDIQTGGWGVLIRSSKDIFQMDDEKDDYPDKKDISDDLREKLR